MKETLYKSNMNGLYEFVFHEIKHNNIDLWFYSGVLKNINLEKKYSHHEDLIDVVNKRLFWGLSDSKISEFYDISESHVDAWCNAGCLAIYQYMVRRFYLYEGRT